MDHTCGVFLHVHSSVQFLTDARAVEAAREGVVTRARGRAVTARPCAQVEQRDALQQREGARHARAPRHNQLGAAHDLVGDIRVRVRLSWG